MFHRILVGVDDSPVAQLALARAIELAERGNGRIGLLVSAPEPSGVIWASPIAVPHSRDGLCRQLEQWACRTMEAATLAVPAEIPVTKLVTHGNPAAALMRELEQLRAQRDAMLADRERAEARIAKLTIEVEKISLDRDTARTELEKVLLDRNFIRTELEKVRHQLAKFLRERYGIVLPQDGVLPVRVFEEPGLERVEDLLFARRRPGHVGKLPGRGPAGVPRCPAGSFSR